MIRPRASGARASAASSSAAADAAALHLVGHREQREAPDALAHERERDARDRAVVLGHPGPARVGGRAGARCGPGCGRAGRPPVSPGTAWYSTRRQSSSTAGASPSRIGRIAVWVATRASQARGRWATLSASHGRPEAEAVAQPHVQAPRERTRSRRRRTTRARSATARGCPTGSARRAAPTPGARSCTCTRTTTTTITTTDPAVGAGAQAAPTSL